MLTALRLMVLAWGVATGGQVRNAVTDQPVAGVVVRVQGAADSVLTGPDGRFRIDAPRAAVLRFSRAGFASVDLVARGDTDIVVRIVPAARALEAATITAIRGDDGAPVSQSTLSKATLDARYFGQELPILLTATPSITAYADAGSYSGYSYLRLRGIDQTRINVTVDGVPLNDPEDHFIYYSNFPDFANSFESVQIQRGVGTSSNGVASFAGALTLESVSLASAQRGGELQLATGSFDSQRASAEYQTGLLPGGVAFYGRFSRLATDGYRHHSGNDAYSFFASGGYFGSRTIAKVTAFGGRSRSQLAYLAASASEIAHDPRSNPLRDAERDDFSQYFASGQVTRTLTPTLSATATGYTIWASGDYDVFFDPELDNFNLASRATGVLANATLDRGRLTVTSGVHANTYQRQHFLVIRPDLATRVYDNTGHKTEASAFARASVDLHPVRLSGDVQWRRAGFRYDPDAQAGVPERETHWSFVNPKVGITYQMSRHVSWYASYGRNGREPTRNDLFAGFDNVDTTNADFIGPLDRVRPETVHDLEAGATLQGRTFAVQGNVYAMEFRNEITPIGPLSYIGLPLRKNVGQSYRRGLEVDATYRGVRGLTAGVNATLSWNRISAYTDDATGVTYRDVEPLLTPRLLANQSLRYALTSALGVTLDGRYIGRSFLSNTGDDRFVTPGRFAADAALSWRWTRWTLGARVNNVTDARVYTGGYTDGASSYYYLLAARNLFVTARVGF